MSLADFVRKSADVLQRNSPAILTGFGAAGVVGTAYLAHEAGVKTTQWRAVEVFNDPESKGPTAKEIVEANWQNYIPTALVGAAAIACVIGAHTVHTRRHAALIGAYSLVERAYNEYREKNIERNGEKEHVAITDEIAKDRVEASKSEGGQVMISGTEILCFDVLTGRYFKSDYETIRAAMNDINARCVSRDYASLNEFWYLIGLPPLEMGEELGWNTDNMLEIDYTSLMSEDNKPAMAITFRNHPKPRYHAVWR